MNTPLSYHASLADFDEMIRQGDEHPAASHVARCEHCAVQLERVRRTVAAMAEPVSTRDEQRLARIHQRITQSMGGGVHVLLPTEPIEFDGEPSVEPANGSDTLPTGDAREQASLRRRFNRPALVAAGLAAVAALSVLRPSKSAEAGMIAGSMTLSPAMPKPGETVTVRYTAGATFGRPPVLRLRARVRTAADESYNTGIPVITVGTLRRERDGEYRAQFVLPDSFVFAALAVEDTAATAVDDFGGRTWEVLRATASGTPTFAALDQRAHDLMGRGWEEGLATVRRMVALYPDSVAAWSWLAAYENWMSLVNDSTRNVHRVQAKRLGALYDERNLLTRDNIGRLFWYSRSTDAQLSTVWRSRLLNEAPTNEFAVQERLRELLSAEKKQADTATIIATLDTLWRVAPRNRKDQVTDAALQFLPHTDRYSSAVDTWAVRLSAGTRTVGRERSAARIRLSVPLLRAKGMQELTQLAETSADPARYTRTLDETQRLFTKRVLRSKALTDAALGQALTADGRAREALAVLRSAADESWDTEVFSAVATASLAAGDTNLAMTHLARVRVDPRTTAKRVANIDSTGRRLLGSEKWQATLATQRQEMSRRVLADAEPRRVEDVTLRSLEGRDYSLADLARGKPFIVVIWSPNCGPAVEALSEIDALGRALAERGLPTFTIVEQASRDSTLTRTIDNAKFSLPVFLDPAGKATAAFNNWATPQIYLVDGRRRVQFAPTSDVDLARLRAEAMLAANP